MDYSIKSIVLLLTRFNISSSYKYIATHTAYTVTLSCQTKIPILDLLNKMSYSEVVGHSQAANNDPASERNEQASPYQPPAVQQDISLPPVRLVSNNPTPPTRVVIVTPPQPSPDTQLLQNAVQSQVEIKLFSAVFCSLILFFLATPLSLLVTLPSIYCICKVCNNSYIGALHGNKITNAFW